MAVGLAHGVKCQASTQNTMVGYQDEEMFFFNFRDTYYIKGNNSKNIASKPTSINDTMNRWFVINLVIQ